MVKPILSTVSNMTSEKRTHYTQREWDRTVGYGKVPEEYRYVFDSHTDGKNTKGSEESREKDERALEEGKEYALNDPIWDKRWTYSQTMQDELEPLPE